MSVRPLRVLEVFDSIQGEGLHAGRPTKFIRLAGCNLRCSWCDTDFGLSSEERPIRLVDTYADLDLKSNRENGHLCITGGEPLLQMGEIAELLLSMMVDDVRYSSITIETNGTRNPVGLLNLVDQLSEKEFGCTISAGIRSKLSFCVDYKLPSSGQCSSMADFGLIRKELGLSDCVKFVIADERDLSTAVQVCTEQNWFVWPRSQTNVFFSPVFGTEADVKELSCRIVRTLRMAPTWSNVRLGLQLHKIIGVK